MHNAQEEQRILPPSTLSGMDDEESITVICAWREVEFVHLRRSTDRMYVGRSEEEQHCKTLLLSLILTRIIN
jgi:hypothetical protein